MVWAGDRLRLLDQRRLPLEEAWLELTSASEVADAIREMAVRGAPAIGVAAAYGMALAAFHGENRQVADAILRSSRPTAVNLFWALDRIGLVKEWSGNEILAEAMRIESEDREANLAIGRHGAELLRPGTRILTVCNTGSLATAGHGTALGVIRTGHEKGVLSHVYACETRPRQQGLRLTAWELTKDGIPFSAIADGAAGYLMRLGKVDAVIAGADRIAANGDTANKIGTYTLAVLARAHGIPFYIAAPMSTVDLAIKDGSQIPIEERSAEELTIIDGHCVAPSGCPVYNPAFDVTPAELISAIITEKGVALPPFQFPP
ncbi:MAG: Methylthioribose-1-phosphate isomerase [Fimbriimonadaceae bacterium]|nr:Methylthioribose-1-phosphate isomerase [Fimbriimonadaceae bacterium]